MPWVRRRPPGMPRNRWLRRHRLPCNPLRNRPAFFPPGRPVRNLQFVFEHVGFDRVGRHRDHRVQRRFADFASHHGRLAGSAGPIFLNGCVDAASTATSASTSPQAALQDLFSQIDANGDGEISKSEFENALGAGGTNTAAADNVFSQLDTNGDGSVSLSELSAALKGGGHHGGTRHHHAASSSTSGSSADQSSDPLLQALAAGSATSSGSSNTLSTASLTSVDASSLQSISLSTSSYNSLEQCSSASRRCRSPPRA